MLEATIGPRAEHERMSPRMHRYARTGEMTNGTGRQNETRRRPKNKNRVKEEGSPGGSVNIDDIVCSDPEVNETSGDL